MTEGVKTVYERIDDYKFILKGIAKKYGYDENRIYDSEDAVQYDKAMKKLRTYQVLARKMEANAKPVH